MLQRRLPVLLLALSFLATLACSKATTKKDEPRDDEPGTDVLGLTEPGFKTAQRQQVDAAIGRSRESGKPLLVRITGAWCAPCFGLNEALEAGKEKVRPALQRYEVLVLDEVFYERSALNDFLPTENIYFPVYFLYHPGNDQWTAYSTGGTIEGLLEQFAETLNTYADEGSLTDLYAKRYAEAKDRPIEFDTKLGRRGYYVTMSRAEDLALNGTVAEVDAFLAELEADLDRMSAAGTPSTGIDVWGVSGIVMPLLVATGKLPAADARQRLAQEAANASATPASQYRFINDATLKAEVHRITLKEGLVAGATRCEEISRDQFVGLPGETANKASIRGLQCALLGLHAGTIDKATALARATAVEGDQALLDAEYPYAALSRLHLAAGDLEGAAVWAGKASDDWSKSFDETVAEIPADLAEIDAEIAAERAGANRPEVIAALEERRADKADNTEFYPKLKAYTQKAYADLQALLRGGNSQPGLAHGTTGVETP